ncbi:MAG TPA: glycosyltransferase 87 family protein [Gaiellaceae bacterium]|nr:glycosyltransferase 87 family protein [Gaiellaceae bacterium]
MTPSRWAWRRSGARALLAPRRAREGAAFALFAAMPAAALALLVLDSVRDGAAALDFRVFYEAAEQLVRGESPYPGYVYPPLPAFASVPLVALPFEAAAVVVMLALAGCAAGTLAAVGVRDWRCYGAALLWPSVLAGVQTGNVTLVLALCAALAWRVRDRAPAAGAAVGIALAAKLVLWPLVLWLAASRRAAAAAFACVAGVALVILPWGLLGFSGLGGYLNVVRRVEGEVRGDSYTLYVVALDLGAGEALARAVWLGLGGVLLLATVVVAWRGNERGAFVLALAAALALSPIVWLHYFALLLPAVAVAQPRLGPLWVLPLLMYVTPGSGHPTPFQTAATLAAAALTIALCYASTREAPAGRPAPRAAQARPGEA